MAETKGIYLSSYEGERGEAWNMHLVICGSKAGSDILPSQPCDAPGGGLDAADD